MDCITLLSAEGADILTADEGIPKSLHGVSDEVSYVHRIAVFLIVPLAQLEVGFNSVVLPHKINELLDERRQGVDQL